MAVALLLAASSSTAAPRKLPLPELIELAKQRGRLVALARARVVVSEGLKREALSNWAPTGDLTYVITGTPAIECRGPGNDADPTIRVRECVNTVDPSTGNTVSTISSGIHGVGMQGSLNLVQPLYTFGKIEAGTRAASHGITAYRALVEAAILDAEMDTSRAYWGLKASRAAVATLESVRDELVPWVQKIERDLEGDKPEYTLSDLQRLKTALDEIDVVRADLQRNAAVALAGLQALVLEEVEIDDHELEPERPVEHPLAYYESAALANRPELHALDEGGAALRSVARLRRNEMLPDLGLAASIMLRYSSSIETPDNVFLEQATTTRFALFLALRQPLDFVQKWARLRHARADVEVRSAERAAAQTGISFEVRKARADLEEAERRMAATDHGQKTARGWLTAVKANLDLGTAEPRDLSDSARKYIELRLLFYKAINDVNIGIAALKRATATDPRK